MFYWSKYGKTGLGRASATVPAGTSIYQQSQLVAENVLEVAREGLYVDYAEASDEAIILRYPAENIINWRTKRINGRDQLVLVVLRECVEEPDGYAYKDEIQYRELALQEGRFICRVWRRAGGTASGTYTVDSEYKNKRRWDIYRDRLTRRWYQYGDVFNRHQYNRLRLNDRSKRSI